MNEAKPSFWKDILSQRRLLFILLGAVCCVAGLFLLGMWFLSVQARLATPLSKSNCEEMGFLVKEGEGAAQIANRLEQNNIIKSDFAFLYYVKKERIAGSLQAGEYLVSPCMSIIDIAGMFQDGAVTKGVSLTFPEGFTLQQIEKLFTVSNFQFPISNFQTSHFSAEYSFLKDAPKDANLEGYLFPDTYRFSEGSDSREVVKRFLDNFNIKVSEEMREEIARQGKTLYEVITMASLIEREVRDPEDMRLVAGVLWKRLSIGMLLQVDATIIYIKGGNNGGLTYTDLEIDSPYNTYIYTGLPPGPISNPGLGSIQAAMYPADSDFLFYLSKPTGETVFSGTLEEHNIAKQKFLR